MSLSLTTSSWFEFVFIECVRLFRELRSFQLNHPQTYEALSRVLGSITIGESTYNVISLIERIANRQIVFSKLEYIQVGQHMVSHLASIYRAMSYFDLTCPPLTSASSDAGTSANTSTATSSSLFDGSTNTTNSFGGEANSEDSEDASNENCS